MKTSLRSLYSPKGFTLVEILVSLTILSIIVVTFLTLFIQSAKTNSGSEDVLDSTYIAQSQMEELYNLSTRANFEEAQKNLQKLGYTSTKTIDGYTLTKSVKSYSLNIQINKPDQSNGLGKVLVQVKNQNGKVKAKMESLINWKQAEGV